MGTSYLKVGKLQDAAFWFAVLKETSKDFHNDAVYNLAYIDYVQQKYDTALQGFREVQDDRKFQKLAPYYIADIYLIQGNYAQDPKGGRCLSGFVSGREACGSDEPYLW